MKGLAATSRLTTRRVPEGLGFNLELDRRYCVVMGSTMFNVKSATGRDADRLCVVLEREYVQLKFDFSVEPIRVVVRELGTPGQNYGQRSRSVSLSHA